MSGRGSRAACMVDLPAIPGTVIDVLADPADDDPNERDERYVRLEDARWLSLEDHAAWPESALDIRFGFSVVATPAQP